jgi:hypothetical protein
MPKIKFSAPFDPKPRERFVARFGDEMASATDKGKPMPKKRMGNKFKQYQEQMEKGPGE